MKPLGVTQFKKKKFKFHNISEEWQGLMGKLPEAFIGVIYGDSGQGKTELCIRLAKELSTIDRVAWLDYEQGHGADLQMALNRNNMQEVNKKFIPIDPMEKLPAPATGETRTDVLFKDVMAYLGKRGSPRFVFFNSLDYTGFTTEHYYQLKETYGKRKGIIFISHAKGNKPKLQVAKDIMYDGQFGIRVKTFIARPEKSRLGGTEDYIIWQEMAEARNPKYFNTNGAVL